jgi:hypothetical protein
VAGDSNKKLDSTRCSHAHQLIEQGGFSKWRPERTRDVRVIKVVMKQKIEHFFKMADFFRTSGVGGNSNKKLDSTRYSRVHQLIQQGAFQNGARRTRDLRVSKVVRNKNIEHFKMAAFWTPAGVAGGSKKKLDIDSAIQMDADQHMVEEINIEVGGYHQVHCQFKMAAVKLVVSSMAPFHMANRKHLFCGWRDEKE